MSAGGPNGCHQGLGEPAGPLLRGAIRQGIWDTQFLRGPADQAAGRPRTGTCAGAARSRDGLDALVTDPGRAPGLRNGMARHGQRQRGAVIMPAGRARGSPRSRSQPARRRQGRRGQPPLTLAVSGQCPAPVRSTRSGTRCLGSGPGRSSAPPGEPSPAPTLSRSAAGVTPNWRIWAWRRHEPTSESVELRELGAHTYVLVVYSLATIREGGGRSDLQPRFRRSEIS